MADKPALWIIAGANGSGKSTAYERSIIDAPSGAVWFINPDALAGRIADHERLPLNPDANLEAVRRIERWLYASIDAHQTVGVETVLSTSKYRALVDRAHKQGFAVRLIYVFLDNVELNLARVRDRVAKGGHDVPEASIRSRRGRSFAQLSWFFRQADQADVFDNSGAEPRVVVSKAGGRVTIFGRLIGEILEVVERAAPGAAELVRREGEAGAGRRRRRRRRRRRGRRPVAPAIVDNASASGRPP
ncbi:MAG: AAA family ATPase [Caulobacteraceae bacterium]